MKDASFIRFSELIEADGRELWPKLSWPLDWHDCLAFLGYAMVAGTMLYLDLRYSRFFASWQGFNWFVTAWMMITALYAFFIVTRKVPSFCHAWIRELRRRRKWRRVSNAPLPELQWELVRTFMDEFFCQASRARVEYFNDRTRLAYPGHILSAVAEHSQLDGSSRGEFTGTYNGHDLVGRFMESPSAELLEQERMLKQNPSLRRDTLPWVPDYAYDCTLVIDGQSVPDDEAINFYLRHESLIHVAARYYSIMASMEQRQADALQTAETEKQKRDECRASSEVSRQRFLETKQSLEERLK